MELFESWALSLIVFLPMVGALVALAIPKEREEAVKLWTLLVSGATLLLAVVVAAVSTSERPVVSSSRWIYPGSGQSAPTIT